MEILYIWFPKYKNLIEQGINFSSEYQFEVEKKKKNEYELKIQKNKKFIPNFFKHSNISNVTAIIGQNGSGKSNIIDYIKTSFPEGYSRLAQIATIVLRLKDGETEIKAVLTPDHNYTFEIIQNDLEFKLFKYPEDLATDTDLRGVDFRAADYIYYSNIFDLKLEESNMAGCHNISTISLIQSDHEESEYLNINISQIDSYRSNELRRNIQFLESKWRDYLKQFGLLLPTELSISILPVVSQYKDKLNVELNRILNKYLNDLENNKDSKQLFLNNLYLSIFIDFIVQDSRNNINFTDQWVFDEAPTLRAFVFNFFERLPDVKYYENKSSKPEDFEPHYKASGNFKKLIILVEELVDKGELKVKSPDLLALPISYDSLKNFDRFIQSYLAFKRLHDFLDFKWRNLSSGEQSLFTLLSRFYNLKQYGYRDLKKFQIILIDEGDIYFHPAWQRRFFNLIIDFLSGLFHDNLIQIVFTSNTPFITSDLTKSHIVFIEKQNNTTVIHSHNNNRAQTFGSNIHTLLSDSFYMEGPLIGSFAEIKINEIISYLKDDSALDINEDYKLIIDQVGEPLIRRKLQELWVKKFGEDEEIEMLQQRLDYLKMERKRKKKK